MRPGPDAVRALVALGVFLLGAGLLAWWAPGVPPVPASPREPLRLPATALQPIGLQAEIDGQALRLTVPERDGTRLLLASGLTVTADDYAFLHYTVPELPPRLRLALVWRRAEPGARYQRVLLPRSEAGAEVIRTEGLPDWSGTLETLGWMVLPADLLPDDAVRGTSLVLGELALHPSTRALALRAWLTEVRAFRPWTGRSINTQGFGLDTPQRHLLLPWLAALAVLAGGLLCWVRRWPWRRLALAVFCGAVMGWGLLQLQLLAQMARRAQWSEHLHASGFQPAVQPGLAEAVSTLSSTLQAAGLAEAPLVVLSDDPFLRSHVPWALLPLRAVSLPPSQLAARTPPRGVVVLVHRSARWQHGDGQLRVGDLRVAATPLLEAGHWSAFRLGDGGAP